MKENLYLQLALKLNSQEFPSLQKQLTVLQKTVYVLLQFLAFCLGKILFCNVKISNAFIRFLSKVQSKTNRFPSINLEEYCQIKQPVLFLVSHPLTNAQQAPLLAQMLWFCAQLAYIINPRKKFLLVHAVDQFGLDSLSWPLRGFYSGLVMSRHIAVHRNPQEFNLLQRQIYSSAQHHRTIFKIIRALKNGDFVFMAPSGGIASNTRIFYTVKEWAYRVYKENYLQNLKDCQGKKVTKSAFAWNFVQKLFDLESKKIPQLSLNAAEKQIVLDLLSRFISDPKLQEFYLQELDVEMQLHTPFRTRLFKILASRVARQKSLTLIALHHGLPVQIKAELPVTLSLDNRICAFAQTKIKTISIEQFVLNFLQPF